MSAPIATLFAALIPAAVAVIIAILTSAPTSLRNTERLTDIASKMSPSSERTLVEDLRDDLVVAWALDQMAPAFSARRAWSWALLVLGALTGIIWIFVGIVTHNAWWTWVLYGVGLALLVAGSVVRGFVVQKRRAWMHNQREDRWIRLPIHDRLRGAVKGAD